MGMHIQRSGFGANINGRLKSLGVGVAATGMSGRIDADDVRARQAILTGSTASLRIDQTGGNARALFFQDTGFHTQPALEVTMAPGFPELRWGTGVAGYDTSLGRTGTSTLTLTGKLTVSSALYGLALLGAINTMAWGATVTPDASLGNDQVVTATTADAWTLANPINPPSGTQRQTIRVTVRNTSGGALGALTPGALYKAPALTLPADGQSRTWEFRWNGTNWVFVAGTTVDVPN